MLSAISAAIGYTWSLPFENPFIMWFQSVGGTQSFGHYFLYYLMNFLSMLGEETVLVGIIGLLYWGLDKKGGERVGFMMISGAVINPLIKNLVKRTRPFDSNAGIQNFRDVSGYSFPSGHSSGSSSTFAGTAVTYRDKKWKWLLAVAIVVPMLVALSRTYVGAHYPTDVVCGLVLGVTLALLIDFLYKVIPNKYYMYGGMAIIGAAGFFYCTTDDYFTAYGLLLGLIGGVIFEEKLVKFENTKVWWRVLLRVIVGGGLYLGLNAAFKGVIGGIYKAATHGGDYKTNFWFESSFRTVRYGIIGFLIIGVYPMLFKYTEKLWRKLGWIKDNVSEVQTEQASEAAEPKRNILATIGFALSFVCGLAGLPVSAIACYRARKKGYDGKKMSVAGICVSVAWIAIFALCMLALLSCLKGNYIMMSPKAA